MNIEIVIPIKMTKVGNNYVNRTEFPVEEHWHGKYIGVGFPKIYNIYRAHWDNKRKELIWSFKWHYNE